MKWFFRPQKEHVFSDGVLFAKKIVADVSTRTPNFDDASFLFEKKYGHQVPVPASKTYIGNHFSRQQMIGLFAVILSAFLLILGRAVQLQLLHGAEYRRLAEGNRQRRVPIPAERGLIFDRVGRELTKNIPKFSLALISQDLPKSLPARHKIITKLAELTGSPPDDIEALLSEYGSYSYESITIKDDIDYETALSIQIAAAELPGITIERGSKRLYLHTPLDNQNVTSTFTSLAHILGYVGKLDHSELDTLYQAGYLPSDTIGKTGVEKTYEQMLRGVYGNRRIEINARGKQQTVLSEQAPRLGTHVQLTIDLAMEQKLTELLAAALKTTHTDRAAAIVLDPNSGAILALVSLPTFDNNDFAGGISTTTYAQYLHNPNHPLFNRAIGGTYPSGSTIKPAIASAALQEHIIQPLTSIQSTGGIRVGQWFFPDWKVGGHGATNVRASLAWSVNTFYYYIGGGYGDFHGLGVEKMIEYLRQFGFGQALGIDLPGEADGFLPTKEWKKATLGESWYIGDTYNLSIGQGHLLVTPLQIAIMTAAVANGGTVYEPKVVDGLINPITSDVTPVTSTILRDQIIESANLLTIRRGMRDCVEYGSCYRLSRLPFAAAGKTGTAQWNSQKNTHAWFTSFAPFEKPEIVVTVLVEEGGEGSVAAAPVAEEFYRWWWQQKQI